MHNPTGIHVPHLADFTPAEHAVFAANDDVAETAARWAGGCWNAGPVAAVGASVPGFRVEDLPF